MNRKLLAAVYETIQRQSLLGNSGREIVENFRESQGCSMQVWLVLCQEFQGGIKGVPSAWNLGLPKASTDALLLETFTTNDEPFWSFRPLYEQTSATSCGCNGITDIFDKPLLSFLTQVAIRECRLSVDAFMKMLRLETDNFSYESEVKVSSTVCANASRALSLASGFCSLIHDHEVY